MARRCANLAASKTSKGQSLRLYVEGLSSSGDEIITSAGGGGTENGYASHLSDYTARGGSHSNSETWVEVGFDSP